MRSVGARKKTLAKQLDREERREAIGELSRARERLRYERRDLLMAARSADLFGSRKADPQATERIRNLRKRYRNVTSREARLKAGAALPFAFNVHFADVAARGGFDLIVGNPPWVRIHNIGAGTRAALNREFLCFSRGAWRDGAELAGSGKAFANQVDLASLFLERSVFLLRERGSLALLLPSKLWRSLAGGGVRDLVSRNLEVVALEDMTESRSGFDAAVYPSLLVGTRTVAPPSTDRVLAAAVHRGPSVLQWEMSQDQLHLDRSPGSPWLLMPSQVRASFDKLSAMGASLGASHLGRPMLGVKTGFNSAFILRDGEPVGDIGAEFLRPVVRGETASAWSYSPSGERIVWAHGEDGRPLRQITPELERHLGKWRTTLERRTDARGSGRWWSVFRTEGASRKYWRVVWCDFGKSPRAFVLAAGSDVVPLNTCYVARCAQRENALALMTLLNGPLLNAWLNAIAEPARGGYRRYLGWTVSLMPIPRDWNRAVSVLSPLAENALRGAIPTRHDLLVASLEAYRVKQADVEPLISWAFP